MPCCIKLSNGDSPPYTCCCGCSLLWGIAFIFIMEVLYLWGSITIMDLTGIIVSGILVLFFLISFFFRDNLWVRQSLFYTYLLRALIFAVKSVIYCFQENATSIMEKACNEIHKVFEWEGCKSDFASIFWVVVAIYVLTLFLFRLLLARILYYYHKEKVLEQYGHHENKQYGTLAGENQSN